MSASSLPVSSVVSAPEGLRPLIQNAVARPAIAEVQTNRELVSFENHVSIYPNSARLFIAGLLFCALSTSNIGSVSHPAETGLLIPSGKPAFRTCAWRGPRTAMWEITAACVLVQTDPAPAFFVTIRNTLQNEENPRGSWTICRLGA